MCRMLGVMCNDGDLIGCAIDEVRPALQISGDKRHDGIGVGYYSNDDPLLKKRPSAKISEIDYTELLEGISSNVLLVHVRQATVGAWKDTNTHPFRFRKWLYAHVGHFPRLEKNREEVLRNLPPFLLRNIQGETDSELAFHLFLNVLFKTGKLNDLSLGVEQLAGHLKASLLEAVSLQPGNQQHSQMAILMTNGQVMAAACRGISMHYSHREGIQECPRHGNSERQLQVHRRFRGIMLGADMSDPGHQWREVAEGSMLTISKELELKVQQL